MSFLGRPAFTPARLVISMFRNYLKVALRSLRKHTAYSAINIVGLAVGLTCCVLILLFVEDELGYDRYHEDAEQIYRLRVERFAGGGESEYTSSAAAPMLPAALNDIPQIESGTRVNQRTYLVRYEDVSFFEERFLFVDSTFFDVFSFELIRGEANGGLNAPNSLVLTASTARKYFGLADPLGQSLDVEGTEMTVTGVVEDTPSQSHFAFDMLGSFSTMETTRGPSSAWNWWSLSYHTYLKIRSGSNVAEAEAQVREMPSRYIGDQESQSGYRQFLYLQPLVDIHLNSHYRFELGTNSQKGYVFVFGAIAFFILLIACINFMNLSTARSAERAKEVGMRKVAGARLSQLVTQFLGESIIITLIALVGSLVLIQALLPLFNGLAFKALSLDYIERWPVLLTMVMGAVGVGALTGLYPAFALSAFKPIDVLKGGSLPGSRGAWMRQSLVVFQFSVSVILIIGAVIAQQQLGFMRSADMGFDKEQVLVINGRNNTVFQNQFEPLKQSLMNVSGVRSVTVSSSIPGRTMGTNVAARQKGMTEDGQTFYYMAVDYDFIEAYGLDIKSGRGFSREMGSDDSLAFVLNEAAYLALGWQDAEEPVGEEVTRQFSDTRSVIGVAGDFNYQSLQFGVEPLVLFIQPSWYSYASVKLPSENIQATVAALEQVWNTFSPERPFEYFFLDDDFDQQYRSEVRISSLLNVFMMLAILIACLGLFALASFVTERRRKEIGVRKVLGASTSEIVTMLSFSFVKPVLISSLLAIPIAWLVANRWLDSFATRISLGWDIFAIAIFVSLSIALITVARQSVKAALADPAVSLRTE
jgi:putative ABC transport system permease protein